MACKPALVSMDFTEIDQKMRVHLHAPAAPGRALIFRTAIQLADQVQNYRGAFALYLRFIDS
jgi:hypothetical protein